MMVKGDMCGKYLNEGLWGQIHSLANSPAMNIFGGLGWGITSRVKTEGSRIAHGASRSACVARRTAATAHVGSSNAGSWSLRTTVLRGIAGAL